MIRYLVGRNPSCRGCRKVVELLRKALAGVLKCADCGAAWGVGPPDMM